MMFVVLFGIFFVIISIWFSQETFPPSGRFYTALLVCALGGGITALSGHIFCERAFPAFRVYEAIFTTPFFVFLSLAFWFGYQPALKKHIYDNAPQWQGTEHYTLPGHASRRTQKKST
jgi:uncharacterized membrane protein YGL010W